MHARGHYEDWQAERESVTQLYVRPVAPRFTPTVQPIIRITSRPAAQQPVASGTMAVTAPPRNWVGVGFLAACVVIGVLIGTVLSLRGGNAIAAPTPVVAAPAPVSHIVVSPIADEPVANGTLLVSAKPPCAIAIDGRPTGLTTPQHALPLAAGHHEVTLTNAAHGIELTADVEISADQSTRLVKDFTK